MLVLGIDPGPEHVGWALLEVTVGGGGIAVVVGCGRVEVSALTFDGPELVSVERPDFRPIGGRGHVAQSLAMGRALVTTAWIGGGIAADARARGYRVVAPTCGEVRRALAGKPTATDRELAWALGHYVELPKRSNNHTRDAMAVALVGARMVEAGSAAAKVVGAIKQARDKP
jgi:Holliday junction resolvasome RuvABC endonuclease subunit